ncbi:MAG: redox-sensing transcriptional repressor Rex [Acidobacteriota bacterium]
MTEPAPPDQPTDLSPLTLNRLSVYLRCLRRLEGEGKVTISSADLARRFHLSATLIRKDLAQFGELGIRGVGYDIVKLRARLETILGVDREHRAVIVGAGNLGSALARFPGFNRGAFRIAALVDNDPAKAGQVIGAFTVRPSAELADVVHEHHIELGILAVPPEAAQDNYDALADTGILAVLNFAPAHIVERTGVPIKTVDFLIFLEELAYLLRGNES